MFELEDELYLEEELTATRMVNAAQVDCARLDRRLPIFKAIGTTDPVGQLETVCKRAVAMLDNTVAELARIRERVRAGNPPAFPLIGDLLAWSLQTRMLMRVSDPMAWTGRGPRTAEQIVRWLTNIRKTIAGGDLWYTCLASGCSPTTRAFVLPGRFRIHLCRLFWRPKPGIDAATHLEYQAQTIIHEVSHIYYDTEDVGRGPGSAHCIAQFVADANGSPIRKEIVGRCGPREPTLHRENALDSYEEELVDEYLEEQGPYQWPRSRSFNPSSQSIPVGPPKTSTPCEAITDDFTNLTLAVGDLKNELRRSPENLARLRNRSDVARALSRQIVGRLQSGWYVQRGCKRQDMSLFASAVNTMRGGGADPDTGSWPLARSPMAKAERTAARQSLRHLLNWIRRAERGFPRI